MVTVEFLLEKRFLRGIERKRGIYREDSWVNIFGLQPSEETVEKEGVRGVGLLNKVVYNLERHREVEKEGI